MTEIPRLYSTGRSVRPVSTELSSNTLATGEMTPSDRADILSSAARAYELRPSMFSTSDREVFKAAETFYRAGYSTDRSLLNPENALHVIMLADSYAATTDPGKQVWLREVAVRAIDITEAGMTGEKTPFRKREDNKYDRFVERMTLIPSSQQAELQCRKFGPGTLLYRLRSELGITVNNESPYTVAVLNLSSEEMNDVWGGIGFAGTNSEGTKQIILPYDTTDLTLNHEYAHTQGSISRGGMGKVLFQGLNEALTENFTRKRRSYEGIRILLSSLVRRDRDLSGQLKQAYMGDKSAWFAIEKNWVHTYGLRGLLALATASPEEDPIHLQKAYGANAAIFMPHKVVVDALGPEHLRYYKQAATPQLSVIRRRWIVPV